ncbi:hypothetical protein D6777_03985 [Candidatus Woesearchaeota archaeon]|nr:MAG: hypothetical protein D6777_03985 [Candidatus Woesearchaeota archaeon]
MRKIIVVVIITLVGCTTHPKPSNSNQNHLLPEYDCKTDCQCDLGYCEQNLDYISGRWSSVKFYEAFSDDGTSLSGYTEYPISDGDCLFDIKADFSFIFYYKENTPLLVNRYGVLYVKLYKTLFCSNRVIEKSEAFSYWYWDFYNPTFISGMLLYDKMWSQLGDDNTGAILYLINDEGPSTIMINCKEVWGDFTVEYKSRIGQCKPNQIHCYSNNNCTALIADCMDKKESCENINGKSYSPHTLNHFIETCYQL